MREITIRLLFHLLNISFPFHIFNFSHSLRPAILDMTSCTWLLLTDIKPTYIPCKVSPLLNFKIIPQKVEDLRRFQICARFQNFIRFSDLCKIIFILEAVKKSVFGGLQILHVFFWGKRQGYINSNGAKRPENSSITEKYRQLFTKIKIIILGPGVAQVQQKWF